MDVWSAVCWQAWELNALLRPKLFGNKYKYRYIFQSIKRTTARISTCCPHVSSMAAEWLLTTVCAQVDVWTALCWHTVIEMGHCFWPVLASFQLSNSVFLCLLKYDFLFVVEVHYAAFCWLWFVLIFCLSWTCTIIYY